MSNNEKVHSTPAPAYEQHQEFHELTPTQPPTAYMQPPMQPPAQNQGVQPGTAHPSGYNTSSPLHALQRAPAPVDCPVCGQREMTRVEAESGKTTQYVFLA
ncbi:hypothetical protein EYZ11_012497 [Aspergillus tanneri]|uniref:LITAF domain-containing protein n=1 Tax=Aspergillus tanneri TaxID=1220188 RepID=A0A4S3J0C9_9EURO|nr:hypothetical protein EYZ11_012497 [Aspergillus tanneri]